MPPYTIQDDETALGAFMRAHSFALLVTPDPAGGLHATHLPWLVDQADDGGLMLRGHVARANPHWQALEAADSLVVFTGPHAYVSPAWYETSPNVPTWNYVAVHATGRAKAVSDPAWLTNVLARSVDTYEAGREGRWRMDLPPEYQARMVAGIVGIALPVAKLEGKFKLSQNRSEADRAGVIAGLRAEGSPEAMAVAELMAGL